MSIGGEDTKKSQPDTMMDGDTPIIADHVGLLEYRVGSQI